MVRRFVAELRSRQVLCAGSELSTRVLRKVFVILKVVADLRSRAANRVASINYRANGLAAGRLAAWRAKAGGDILASLLPLA
jgi:hypothetical protein